MLPLGSFGFEREPSVQGQRLIWVEAAVCDRLAVLRRPGESLILRLVEIEAG